jgi:hypothetical protein
MTVVNREKAIADFEGRADVMVLIVSLKAAALGLNLTAANHVVLLDLWWNPTIEEQVCRGGWGQGRANKHVAAATCWNRECCVGEG